MALRYLTLTLMLTFACVACSKGLPKMVRADGPLMREAFELSDDGGSRLPANWGHTHFQGTAKVEVVGAIAQVGDRQALVLRSPATGQALDTFYVPLELGRAVDRPIRVRFEYRAEGEMAPLFIVSSEPGAGNPAIKHRPVLKRDGEWHSCSLDYDVRGLPPQAVFEILIERKVEAGATFAIDDLVIESLPLPPLAVRMVSPAAPWLVADGAIEPVILEVEAGGEVTLDLQIEQSGRVLRSEAFDVSGTRRLQVPVSDLAEGEYSLRGRCEQLGWEQEWKLKIIAPKASSVLIRDNTIIRNGEPFFPIALFRSDDLILKRLKEADAPIDMSRGAMLRDLADRGFNTVHYSWQPPPIDYLDEAHRHQLMVVAETNLDFDSIPTLRDHPALLGYYYADEPLPSQSKQLKAAYLRYRELDPYHPVMTAINNESVGFSGDRFIDIALPDPYPIGGPTSTLEEVIPAVRNAASLLNADDPRSSVFIVPQLFTSSINRWHGFEPTYEQLRANTYAGLAAGAKGVFYFSYWAHEPLDQGMSGNPDRKYWYLPESKLWDRIGELNAELLEISPAILDGQVSEVPSDRKGFVGRVWQRNQEAIIVLVNTTGESMEQMRCRLPEGIGEIQPVYGTLPISDRNMESNTIGLDLPPYGVAVYRCEMRSAFRGEKR